MWSPETEILLKSYQENDKIERKRQKIADREGRLKSEIQHWRFIKFQTYIALVYVWFNLLKEMNNTRRLYKQTWFVGTFNNSITSSIE